MAAFRNINAAMRSWKQTRKFLSKQQVVYWTVSKRSERLLRSRPEQKVWWRNIRQSDLSVSFLSSTARPAWRKRAKVLTPTQLCASREFSSAVFRRRPRSRAGPRWGRVALVFVLGGKDGRRGGFGFRGHILPFVVNDPPKSYCHRQLFRLSQITWIDRKSKKRTCCHWIERHGRRLCKIMN